MALIYCRECGRTISDTAPMCPYCGSPQSMPPSMPSGMQQGMQQGMQYGQNTPYYEPENKNNVWIYVISALIGVLLFVVIFLLFSTFAPKCNRSSNKETTSQQQTTTDNTSEKSHHHSDYDYRNYDYTSKHAEIEAWKGVVSSRRLDEGDIAGMSNDDLCLLRNLIYAKHGYIFKKSRFREFFSAYSWYSPRHSNVSHSLNSIENYNVDFIKRHEW